MPFLPRNIQSLGSPYDRRDSPKIGGSEGGFIGLLVGLIVIILGSSIAIYILLRDHSPSDRERQARREQRRYPSEASRVSFKPRLPWSEKLGGMFGRGTSSKKGWIQASDDAWEADANREMSGLHPVDQPFRPPLDPYSIPSYSSDSVPYDPPEPRYTPASHSTMSDLHSHESVIPRSTSPESTVPPHSPEQNKDRHLSIESASSVRTFEGGTKFIEGL
ncbi:hypothetical protein R3P38DRAFT_1347407 [Favolaschia claudopus]|uniref:Uncharacterized protein n=1 Tax=Favolaschia claudopus TaxID=2862362 RepID=A0AAW0DWA8_9AGAR